MEFTERGRIRRSFSKVKEDISLLKESGESTDKVMKDIRESLDSLREQLREVTTRSTTRSNEITPLKSIQKKVFKSIDKAQIMKAIKHYIDEGYKTNQIRDEIIMRFNIKTTCFYKYLKLLREQLREVTTRSTTRSSNK